LKRAAAALGVSLLSAGWAFAQQDTFRGRVVAGVESSEILVSLERQNGQIVAQALTDDRGIFQFRNVSTADRANDNYVYIVSSGTRWRPPCS
jgi:hypothetical protein